MKKTILTKIQKKLLEEKEIISSKQSMPIDIDISGDEVDKIQSNIILHNHKQLMLRSSNRLKQINDALLRISEGSYGMCKSCCEPISIERIKANPTCAYCIVCAEEMERGYKK